MNRASTRLSALVLTEDSGIKAFETLRAIVKELLKQVDEHVQTNRISFEPVRNELALKALHANLWKSTNPKDRAKQVELVRTLATQLMLEDGWVFFHFDGDRAWNDRESSENVAKFQTLVRERVRQLVMSNLSGLRDGISPQAIAALSQARMTRLKVVVPFYSIEAWLFQNTREAIRISQHFYGSRDIEQFQSWAEDRAAIDEVLKPKESVILGSAHNLDLASNSFPTRDVQAVGKSFTATVNSLKQDSELCAALAQTYGS